MAFESKTRRLLHVAALFVLGASTLAGPAPAQSSSDRETARSLMDQGDAAMSKKDHAAALKAFQAADQIMRVPTTGLAVARAQAALGKLVDARDTALRVARIPVKPEEPGVFAEARSEATLIADSLAARIASLTITLEPAPSGAKVTLDGGEVPSTLLGVPKKIDPGKHVVVASAPGFDDKRVEVTLADGAQQSVALKLEPKRADTPGAVTQPAPGDEATSGGGTSPLVYIGFGVGAAGIAVGSVTGLMSLSKASSAKDQCDGNVCPTAAKDDADSSKTLANISNIGFAVGIVGIGVGVFGLLSSKSTTSEKPPTARAPRVEPIVGARFVGIQGSF